MSAQESIPETGPDSIYKIDKLPRGVKAYAQAEESDGVRISGLVDGIRLAGRIYAQVGDKIVDVGIDNHPLEGEYITLKDVPRILGELAAKNKLGDQDAGLADD